MHCPSSSVLIALAFAAAGLGVTARAPAAVSLTVGGEDAFVDNFTGFAGTGNPANWTTADVSLTSNWLGQGDGASNTGGKYSFGVGSDGSLGFLPSSTRAISARIDFVNNTGASITEFTFEYTGEQWRTGGGTRVNGWAVNWLLNNANQGALGALTYTSTVAATASNGLTNVQNKSATVSGVNIPVGATFSFVFNGDNGATGSGSRNGVAIDNVGLGVVVPEPAGLALLGTVGLAMLRRRR